jgi:integrase
MTAVATFATLPATVTAGSRDPVVVYLAGLAPTGRRAMQHRLAAAAALLTGGKPGRGQPKASLALPWHSLTFAHVSALRAKLLEHYRSPATVNLTLAAVRGVARAAFNLGLMPAEEYTRLRNVGPVTGSTLPKGRALTRGEVEAMLDTCEATPAGRRDAALLALAYTTGCRRAELVALDLADFDQDSGELKVRGKGNRERLVHVVNGTASALRDYLAVRGDAPGPLFLPSRKGGELVQRRMTAQAVYALLRTRADKAGVAPFGPHDLRRSCVTALLEAGADLGVVQKLAGHANVATTARYDRRDERAKRQAAGLLHVSYRPRA